MGDPEGRDRSGDLSPAILLVDMDAFFASVEVRDRPELAGQPVLVGGDGARGVVASCTYEARRFGIRSAMPMATAKRLCPQAVIIGGNIGRYAAVSRELHAILRDVTPLVEPLGLDEAFLDVTGSKGILGTPRQMALSIRERVARELSLDCAVGIGPSKLVAKMASKEAKPHIVAGSIEDGPGVVVIMDDEVRDYLDRLDVSSLFGVGPATARALGRLGIERVSDLARMDPAILARHLGRSHAAGLVALARGEDHRPVVADVESKSIGHEETFATDIWDVSVLEQRLRRYATSVASALRGAKRRGRTITVKVKWSDFSMTSRSHTMISGLDDPTALAAVATELLSTIELDLGVRLLGLTASTLESHDRPVQLRLSLDEVPSGWEHAAGAAERIQIERAALDDAITEIRSRFGRDALGMASMLGSSGISVPAQRQVPFGPADPT